MKSSVQQMLPLSLRRSLKKLGSDLGIARRKRHLTTAMMAERIGVAKSTYSRMEQGDPVVSMGAYAIRPWFRKSSGRLDGCAPG